MVHVQSIRRLGKRWQRECVPQWGASPAVSGLRPADGVFALSGEPFGWLWAH